MAKENVDDLIDMLKDCPRSELERLLTAVEELLYADDDPVVSFNYTEIRDKIAARLGDPRVEWSLPPWTVLKKGKKSKFAKAWAKALKQLKKAGIDGSSEGVNILVSNLVSRDKRLTCELTLDNVCDVLANILSSFDDAFPGYRQSGAIPLLNLKLRSVKDESRSV